MKYQHLVLAIVVGMIFGVQKEIKASSCIEFNEVNIMGGFNSPKLKSTIQLWDPNNDFKFTKEMKEEFLKSTALTGLKILELNNKDIDDNFIEEMCKNKTFARLITIDLSNNKNITSKSLKYIRESDIIGSTRDLPQISGKYGCPSSEVYINIDGTGITDKKDIKKYFGEPRSEFVIRYMHPVHNTATYPTINNGIKWLQRK